MNGWRVLEISLGLILLLILPSPYVPNNPSRWRFYNYFAKRGPRAALVLALLFGALTLFLAISALAAHQPVLFLFACCAGAAAIGFIVQRERARKYIASLTAPTPPTEEKTPWWRAPLWAHDDYSRNNQIRKAICQGVGIVGLILTGSTIGFQGGGHLPGQWYLWTGGATILYLTYLVCARPWTTKARAEMIKSDPTHLSPETEAWLTGAPLPPAITSQATTRPDQLD